MEKNAPNAESQLPAGRTSRLRKFLYAIAALVLLLNAEENWRGKRAWDKYRRELEAKGEVLDWHAYIPPPVPDDQNFMKAPLMDSWFTKNPKNTNGLQRLRELADLDGPRKFAEARHGTSFPIVEVQFWPEASTNLPADLVTLKDFGAGGPDQLRQGLSRLAQVPLLSDPRAGPLIIGGGTNRPLRRIHLQLDPANGFKALEEKFKKTDFALAQTPATNVVRILCHNSILAEDVVAWFTQFEPEFNALAEALKRPYARMDSDYQDPGAVPSPNFVSVRTFAQALSVHAKANLLVGKPEAALQDAAQMAGLMRVYDKLYLNLVNAMVCVAIGGLYAHTIGEGLAWDLWQEPQWMALQEQMCTMDLLASYAYAMRGGERAAMIHLFVTVGSWPFSAIEGDRKSFLPEWVYLIASHQLGWFYQDALFLARLHQLGLDAIDVKSQRIDTQKSEQATQTVVRELDRFRPYAPPITRWSAFSSPTASGHCKPPPKTRRW